MSDIDALFMGAAAHHRAGRLKQARAACQALLRVNPKHQDALHLLGLLAYQDGDYMAAAELIDRALLQDPNQAALWMNRGLVHQAQGKTAEAEASYLRTLDLQPHTPVAYRNLGDLFSATNRLEETVNASPVILGDELFLRTEQHLYCIREEQ